MGTKHAKPGDRILVHNDVVDLSLRYIKGKEYEVGENECCGPDEIIIIPDRIYLRDGEYDIVGKTDPTLTKEYISPRDIEQDLRKKRDAILAKVFGTS